MLIALWVVLALLAIGALPVWPHSRAWGFVPSLGLMLVILMLVLLHVSNVI